MAARHVLLLSLSASVLSATASAAPLIRSAGGSDATAIQATVDQFRVDLGGSNNGVGGSFAGGRREINWDDVPDLHAAPDPLPANYYNSESPRGVMLATPGTSLQVSADSSNPTLANPEFGHIDPSYPSFFRPYSQQRMFTARGSTITDVEFFIPGTLTPATVSGLRRRVHGCGQRNRHQHPILRDQWGLSRGVLRSPEFRLP